MFWCIGKYIFSSSKINVQGRNSHCNERYDNFAFSRGKFDMIIFMTGFFKDLLNSKRVEIQLITVKGLTSGPLHFKTHIIL